MRISNYGFISLVVFFCTAACADLENISIMTKDIELGSHPVTGKKLIAKGYALIDNVKKVSEGSIIWYIVIPDLKNDKKLLFLVITDNDAITFPVTELIGLSQAKEVFFDPKKQVAVEKPTVAMQKSLIKINVTLSEEVQIFKEFVIALACRNEQALKELIVKYDLDILEKTIKNAIICQGMWTVAWDNLQDLDKKSVNPDSIVVTGKIVFYTLQDILTLLQEVQAQDQAQKAKAAKK